VSSTAEEMAGNLSRGCVAAGAEVGDEMAVYSDREIFARGELIAAGLDGRGLAPAVASFSRFSRWVEPGAGFIGTTLAAGFVTTGVVAAGLLYGLVFLRSTGFSKASSESDESSC
jgi:hypothetical protein